MAIMHITGGFKSNPKKNRMKATKFTVLVSNDEFGKSLSIYDDETDTMFEIPMDSISEYFKDENKIVKEFLTHQKR